MTKTELRTLYQEEMLVEAIIEHSLITDGWIVEFRHSRGGYVPLTDKDGRECSFVDPDSATDFVMEVGFEHVRIMDE